jgi:hypothetical protein
MRYYFTAPEKMLESLEGYKTKDYTILYNQIMAPFTKVGFFLENKNLIDEYNFFILESCRFFLDKKDYDSRDLQLYFELVKRAGDKLLIDRKKIEIYFKEYIDNLFHKKSPAMIIPKDISGVVIDLMLSELDITDMMAHVNLGTQEVDIQSIKDSVRLEKINFVKRMIHDRVLFFIEYYNNYVKKGRYVVN